jgi:AraC-like DNA-binding protein
LKNDLTIVLATGFLVATYPAGATFGPRYLRDWEFVWVIEGDAQYRRNDVTVEAPEGSVVLCRPDAMDFFRWDPRRRTRHAFFHFRIGGTLPAEWPLPETWALVRVGSVSEDLLHPLFRHLLAWNGRGDPTQTRLIALSLLSAFVTGQTQAADIPRDAQPDAVARVAAHIAHRLDEDPAAKIILSELAEVACVTPEHLCRLFKAATGRSPVETVRLARLDRALTLLARTNYSVAEVATLCGFENPFHFSRRFTAVYGQSPRTVRRAIAEGRYTPMTRVMR